MSRRSNIRRFINAFFSWPQGTRCVAVDPMRLFDSTNQKDLLLPPTKTVIPRAPRRFFSFFSGDLPAPKWGILRSQATQRVSPPEESLPNKHLINTLHWIACLCLCQNFVKCLKQRWLPSRLPNFILPPAGHIEWELPSFI